MRLRSKKRACANEEAEGNGAHTPIRNLQQARGAKARNWINQWHRLPLKQHAGHRESQRHIADMNKLHKPTPQIAAKYFVLTTGPSHRGAEQLRPTYPGTVGRSMNQKCHANALK